jgi:hypothetical protein
MVCRSMKMLLVPAAFRGCQSWSHIVHGVFNIRLVSYKQVYLLQL